MSRRPGERAVRHDGRIGSETRAFAPLHDGGFGVGQEVSAGSGAPLPWRRSVGPIRWDAAIRLRWRRAVCHGAGTALRVRHPLGQRRNGRPMCGSGGHDGDMNHETGAGAITGSDISIREGAPA